MFTWAKIAQYGLSIVSGLVSLANKAAAALKSKSDRDQGAIAQKDATDVADVKTLESVTAPVSDAERQLLWDENAKRFGTPGGKTGQ